MPGIYLYTGNRLEILADKFADIVSSAPLPPLDKETILVQSRGMARWLALETAGRLKIWANCECPFPNTFIRNIYKLIFPDISDYSSYQKEYITWHLMDIIPEILESSHFTKIKHYLASDDGLKLYQLARETADLFDQYTIYRPDMILEWETQKNTSSGQQEKWQQLLWSRFIEKLQRKKLNSEFHRGRLLHYFEEKGEKAVFDQQQLPARVSVFGISSLPPYHLRILSVLANYIDLHIFILNPCMEYWFDIIADRDIVKISRKSDSDQDLLHLEHGNSLLSSMGHLGRDFLSLIQELEYNEQELFQDPGPETLLKCIQQDILYLRGNQDPSLASTPVREKIKIDDTSITFQSCHSPMREVEVLHDHLLAILEPANKKEPLEPKDILVMAPDINDYAPLIRAVFDSGASSEIRLPYSISDQSIRKTNKFIEAFINILSLFKSRFSSIEVFGLLKAEPVKNRFSISDHEFSTLERWVDQTHICWGIDLEHKKDINLPNHPENTWRSGLDRLLLGYATAGNGRILFKNILPYDCMEGSDTNLLGKFLDYTEAVFSLKKTFLQKHTLTEWSEILLSVKETFLLADESSEEADRLLLLSINGLKELQAATSFDLAISIDVVRSYLLDSLEQRYSTTAGAAGFLTGGITFCSMLPMRAIPFKAICLLGMNDGMYPRPGRKRSFDLMAQTPRRGDRSRRYDDRYLFLETILSARRKLYISYEGQSIQDGSRNPPSVLVSELMDYIEQGYELEQQNDPHDSIIDRLTTLHRLQPFHPVYFKDREAPDKDEFFSYSAEDCEAATALAAKPSTAPPTVAPSLSPPPDTFAQINLNDLIDFFSHPARHFLVRRIGIAPVEESRSLSTVEPFVMKGLEKYQLEKDILNELLEGNDCEQLYQIKKAEGVLPHGTIGKVHFARTVAAIRSFKNTLDTLFSQKEFHELDINIEINQFKISGRLQILQDTGHVRYRYATIKPKDVIRSWICHLALNRMKVPEIPAGGANTFLAGKDHTYLYRPVPPNCEYLEELLSLYWQGLSEPLHFFPQSSYVYASEIFKGKSEKKALQKAQEHWEGNSVTINAGKKDPYNILCFQNIDLKDTQFMELAEKIYLPIFKHREKFSG
ncbi:MAG: exodeoxyribonuclease V subunit gamma [Deltaproteobacteria bacterium]|jgi:exodeoxyribonuclease V gamma subunit|nr:exodeoxyribonuclease V subunit gamma [Deltaproteobacteria bacterium]